MNNFFWKQYFCETPYCIVSQGLYFCLKICYKSFNEAKKNMSDATPIFFPRSNERGFMVPKIRISKITCKIKSILSGLVTQRLYF